MWENFSLIDESISYLSYALSEGRRTAFDDAGAEVRLQLALASAIMYAGGLIPEADRAWDLALALAEQREEPEFNCVLSGAAPHTTFTAVGLPRALGCSACSPTSVTHSATSRLRRTVNVYYALLKCI